MRRGIVQKKSVRYLQGKIRAMAHILKTLLCLLYFLNFGLIAQLHKLECPVKTKRLLRRGQGHSEGRKCKWIFVQMISSEAQNILFPKLVWWCSMICVMRKKMFAIFEVKVTARAHTIKYDSFYCIFWTDDSLATKLGLVVRHHKPECFVEKQGLLRSRSTSPRRLKMSSKPFCSKRGIVMHHHDPEWHAKTLVCFLQGQGHSKGSYDQIHSFYYIFWTADPVASIPGLMLHYHKPDRIMKKFDCFVQGQGHSKHSKCQ